jgi:hypothetical protein
MKPYQISITDWHLIPLNDLILNDVHIHIKCDTFLMDAKINEEKYQIICNTEEQINKYLYF